MSMTRRHKVGTASWLGRGFHTESARGATGGCRPSFVKSVFLAEVEVTHGPIVAGWLRSAKAPLDVLCALVHVDVAPQWPRPDAWRVRVIDGLLLIETVEVEASRNRDPEVLAEAYARAMWWDLDRIGAAGTAAVVYADYARGDPARAYLWHFQAGEAAEAVIAHEAALVGASFVDWSHLGLVYGAGTSDPAVIAQLGLRGAKEAL